MATKAQLLTALRNADAASQEGDEEEREAAAADARKLAAMLKEGRYDDAPQEQQESTQSTMDQIRGGLQSFNKGTTFGWGDEIAGMGRAFLDYGMDALIDNPLADDPDVIQRTQTLPGRYKMYRDDEREVQKTFAEENPKTALGLTLAGSVASPLNRVGPLTKSSTVLQMMGRGGLEGAVTGLGESEGETLEELGASTLGGGAMGIGGAGVVGGAIKGISNKNVKNALKMSVRDAEGNLRSVFRPIHMAADSNSLLGSAYRNIIGRLPGGQQRLQRQEAPFVDEALRELDNARADSVHRLNVSKQAVTEGKREAADAAEQALDDVKTGTALHKEALEQAAAEADDTAAREFRRVAATEAIPPHARSALEDVDLDDPEQVRLALNRYWTESDGAFAEVKSNWFPWGNRGAKALRDRIRERVSNDPDLILELGNALAPLSKMTQRLRLAGLAQAPRSADELVSFIESNIKEIDGEALMAMRNVFASGANGTSKNGYALRQIANEFDDFIRDHLRKTGGDDLVKQFDDNINTYTKALAYMDATRSKAARESGGYFTPGQYMTSSGKYGGKGMSTRTPPLESEARTAVNAGKAPKQALPGARKAAERKAAKSRRDIRRARTKRVRELEDQARVANQRRQQDLGKEGSIGQAATRLRGVTDRVVPKTASPLSQLLTAEYLGGIAPPNLPNRSAKAGRGIALSFGLSGEGAQRFVAGQTELQRAMRAALLRGDMAKYAQLAARLSAMGAVGE